MRGPANVVAMSGVLLMPNKISRFLNEVISARIMVMMYSIPKWPTQYKVCAAAYISTLVHVAFIIIPMTISTAIATNPSHRPQMSITLAIGRLQTPPNIVATMLVVPSKPCWLKAEVIYGTRVPWTDCNN